MSNKLMNRPVNRHEVLIIGGGAAGLTLALNLPSTMKIAVITKNHNTEGSTYYAQGGISAVLRKNDSFKSHIEDTMNAGGGLCDIKAASFTIENGPSVINWLSDLGVPFTKDKHKNGKRTWHLTREGGHSHRRVIHAADATGQALETTLINHVKLSKNIEILDYHIAVDLITGKKLGLEHNRCIGAYVLNKNSMQVETFLPVMALPWQLEPAVALPIWSLCNFTQPVYTIQMLNLFY